MTSPPQILAHCIHSANAANRRGEHAAAADWCRQALHIAPDLPEGWFNLGMALRGLGRRSEAREALGKARARTLGSADAQNSIGLEFLALKAHDEAERCFMRAIALAPDYAFPHSNLGKLHEELKRFKTAEAAFRKAAELQPDLPAAHANLCGILNAMKRYESAEAAGRKAIELDPHSPEAWRNLGSALAGQKRHDEAGAARRKAAEIEAHSPQDWARLAGALFTQKCFREAKAACRKAIELDPHSSVAWNILGSVLFDQRQFPKAEAAFRKAVELAPGSPEAWGNLGGALSEQFRLEEAKAACQKAIELDPEAAPPYGTMARIHLLGGASTEAVAQFEQALDKAPGDTDILSNYLFCLNYLPGTAPEKMTAAARRYGEVVRAGAVPFDSWGCSPEKDRRLRIGLVSSDFGRHPVGYFLRGPLAEILADRYELLAYSNRMKEDDLTAELRRHCAKWTDIAELGDAEAAKRIHDDRVDILMDLSGHTVRNRLPVFAWKAAPVQATWLGYFATTGVGGIDWKIGDPRVTPPGEERHFTERIWRLPDSCFCHSPPDDAPEVAGLPSRANGFITYGCFNNLDKINDKVISAWSRVLRAVPGSRLFLKTKQLDSPEPKKALLARFERHGIAPGRLMLEGAGTHREYLEAHARVDIALDPFPYPGGTTTSDGLWMGVPTVTLRGDRFIAHQGESLLHAAGLPDWIAGSDDDYVDLAVSRAADIRALAELRAGLRSQALASPLFDAPRFARNLEIAWRGMWQAWCGDTLQKTNIPLDR